MRQGYLLTFQIIKKHKLTERLPTKIQKTNNTTEKILVLIFILRLCYCSQYYGGNIFHPIIEYYFKI